MRVSHQFDYDELRIFRQQDFNKVNNEPSNYVFDYLNLAVITSFQSMFFILDVIMTIVLKRIIHALSVENRSMLFP
jgi:hypothetical protein